MSNPTHSSTTPGDAGQNPAASNPPLSGADTDAPMLSKTHTRIDQGAERVKHATSEAVVRTKQAADRVEESVYRATDRAADAAHRANDRAADFADRGRELADETMDRADMWMGKARDYVREKPMQSVAIALGAGWLLGRILRR